MNNSELINLLTIVLGVMIGVLVILCFIFLMLKVKTKKPKNKKEKKNNNSDLKSKSTTTVQSYNKESIFKFMEFDKIDDKMIIQKDGKRYLMVIECQGINYDLMSNVEKTGVEEGFVQFLNTLRYPIQIYVQTRSINLENSLQVYRSKLQEVQDKYDTMSKRYELMLSRPVSTMQRNFSSGVN